MGFYDKNMKALQERFPEIYKRISKENKEETEISVETISARDGNRILEITKDGKKYRLNSLYRPIAEAKKWSEQFALHNINVNVIMFGFGNGIFVREILNRLKEDGKIYVMEPDDKVFKEVLEKENITDILGDTRFEIYLWEDDNTAMKNELFGTVHWTNLSSQVKCTHSGYNELYNEKFVEFWTMITYIDQMALVQRNTNAFFSHTSVRNAIQNIQYIKKSNYVTEFIGKFPEQLPVIIVAAGPSLEKNMKFLRKARDKAFVIATDSAVRNLEENDIPYDCIVTLDPEKPSWYLTNYPGYREKPLFCMSEANHEILREHTGRKIWMPNSLYFRELYIRNGLLFLSSSAGGSVATAALMIAFVMGFKKIILIGQDLAYEGEKTHAGNYEDHIENEEQTIHWVDGYYGGKVRTRGDWEIYRKWYEDFAKQHSDIKFVNATEGGALIHGVKNMSLLEAIDTYGVTSGKFDFQQMLGKIPSTFEVNDFTPFRKEISGLSMGFKNVKEYAQKGKEKTKEFVTLGRKILPQKRNEIVREITKINSLIAKQSGYELLDMYISELTLDKLETINVVKDDEWENDLYTVQCAEGVYDALIEGVEELSDILEDTLLVMN